MSSNVHTIICNMFDTLDEDSQREIMNKLCLASKAGLTMGSVSDVSGVMPHEAKLGTYSDGDKARRYGVWCWVPSGCKGKKNAAWSWSQKNFEGEFAKLKDGSPEGVPDGGVFVVGVAGTDIRIIMHKAEMVTKENRCIDMPDGRKLMLPKGRISLPIWWNDKAGCFKTLAELMGVPT